MLDYLKKFNNLPAEIKGKMSAPAVIAAINELEKKYKVQLAAPIMKLMVRDIKPESFEDFFISEYGLSRPDSSSLVRELNEKALASVHDYLYGKKTEPTHSFSVPVERKTGANFFFSPEDEEEIKSLAAKIETADLSSSEIDHVLEKIISDADINFGNEYLLNRFRDLIKTYLKGIRDKIDIKQALVKSFNEGGLAFDAESANKILIIIEKNKNNPEIGLKPLPRMRVPEDNISQAENKKIMPGLRDVDYDLAALVKKGKDQLKELPAQKIEPKLNPPIPKKALSAPAKTKSIPVKPLEKAAPAKPDFLNVQAAPKSSPVLVKRLDDRSGRKKIEDVKYVPKIMNPIDELRYMDLISFRRLGPSAQIQASKIKEKISLLADEEYAKKIEGIKSWRQSPVSRLYMLIGHESINENKPIDAIIEKRRVEKKDYLTPEEIEAIMNLNKELRY